MPSWFTISQFLKWNWGGLRNEGLFLKRRIWDRRLWVAEEIDVGEHTVRADGVESLACSM